MTPRIVIIGAGAAGLAAACFAGEAARGSGAEVLLLEGARTPGAKILVSGGGRCNVTNERVTPEDFHGGPRPIIRNVLRAFDERRALEWMRALGVELKLEPTGKYFPVSDKARTVLEALVHGAESSGARLISGTRVTSIEAGTERRFAIRIESAAGTIHADRIILASGGLSLPKSGSDGWGLDAARQFGHSIIPTTPALVPLLLRPGNTPGGRFAEFSGVTILARLGLFGDERKPATQVEGSLLFTHLGLSGPAARDMSRHLLRARLVRPAVPWRLGIGHPRFPDADAADVWLRGEAAHGGKRTVVSAIESLYPERIARALTEGLGTLAELTRESRRQLAANLAHLPVDVLGDRGYTFAETTAGGVDLREIAAHTMESRVCPGLHLCGEMLDADGRIGGFNFQWAWATGYLAGRGAVKLARECI
ncbi:aminoacetone oxidase family FAD-binding enzyme [Candidatus Poribacteria bacterium]|nr:aminoacetone oxidase family FAD-binding enzyme [Candidatus Poribacteria bacterium]